MHGFSSRIVQMANPLVQFTFACLIVSLGACGAIPFNLPSQATATQAARPTIGNPAPLVVTATAPASPSTLPGPEPTAASSLTPTPPPTLAPQAAPTLAPSSSPVPTGGGITRVKIFLIAVDDNGKLGEKIGCGDSVVGVERVIAPTRAPLTAALNDLFSQHDQYYGQSGLYNALYRSNLHILGVSIIGGVATIKLTGTLSLGGVCDDPRVEAQITNTARQFSSVRTVEVFLNGVALKNVLSEK
jgi:hypothetical protein